MKDPDEQMKDPDEILRFAGDEALRRVVDEAAAEKLTEEGWCIKLARLSDVEYDRQRATFAAKLGGVRLSTVDALRKKGAEAAGERDEDGEGKAGLLDRLVAIAIEHDLFPDDGGEAYVCVTLGDGGRRTYRCRTASFSEWLRTEFGDRYQQEIAGQTIPATVSSSALTDAVDAIIALARRGKARPVFLRFGWADDALYLDLGTPEPRALEITATSWSIVREPQVHLIYAPSAKPLPVPAVGVDKRVVFRRLSRLFGFKPTDDRFVLLLGVMLAALMPRGPYPVVCLTGEQGSGKSSRSRLIKIVFDPTKVNLRGVPKTSEDLIISTWRSWFAVFDNLSKLSQEMSDWLCRLSEGSGISKRTLYSDLDETLVEAARPILINAIPDVAQSGDLIDRSVFIRCDALSEQIREKIFLQEVEALAPELLGLMVEAAGHALGRFDQMPDSYPGLRRGDWAAWVEAAAPALGLRPGRFVEAYARNQEDAVRLALELDPLARAVTALLDELGLGNDVAQWEGEATLLHQRLGEKARDMDNGRLPMGWPRLTHHLVGRLRRLGPQLRKVGIEFGQGKDSRTRRSIVWLTMLRAGEPYPGENEPSEPSEPSTEAKKSRGNSRGSKAPKAAKARVDPVDVYARENNIASAANGEDHSDAKKPRGNSRRSKAPKAAKAPEPCERVSPRENNADGSVDPDAAPPDARCVWCDRPFDGAAAVRTQGGWEHSEACSTQGKPAPETPPKRSRIKRPRRAT